MAPLITLIALLLVSCGGSLPRATYDDRHYYLNALPWTPAFEIVDSISSLTVLLSEEVVVENRIEKRPFKSPNSVCNLTLWRYPIDTTVTKTTGEGLVLGAPSIPGIVTHIGYVFHSDSLQRGANIDSVGNFNVAVPEGQYLVVLAVGGYYPVYVKDLEVRTLYQSILEVTVPAAVIFIY